MDATLMCVHHHTGSADTVYLVRQPSDDDSAGWERSKERAFRECHALARGGASGDFARVVVVDATGANRGALITDARTKAINAGLPADLYRVQVA